ncbi:hypothetical protein [Neobacillus sp. SuZ13]|uniref:hypothetical protein n=1 Tax=Neobacillus sp. SuZ13 TaxID=3047875 RepID=UPI0024C0CAFA|nr:hypothetical protein [Neobacillus sp. SuZ13]WHY64705.1 hypothetical protein QNH17_16390 [Neobacillus sp. SuZ13]
MAKLQDLTGEKYGKLTVIYRTEDHISKNGNKRVVWHCKCDCGNETDVLALNLTREHTLSCGCARIDGRKKISRDVTGERFGNLVGVKKIENKNTLTRWLFRCDCGNEVECYLSNVTTGKTKSCGKKCGLKVHLLDNRKVKGIRTDFTGQRFDRLIVIKKLDDKNGYTQFRCKCDCGNEKITSGRNLKYGVTKSCGCLHKDIAGTTNFENLVGQRFGKLIVVEQGTSKWNKLHWLCKCDCGNETVVSTSGLKTGHTKSCGCYQDEVASDTHYVDLTGRKFGKLTVIKRAKNSNTGLVRFLCKCDCGNLTTVMNNHLLRSKIQSCGCWKYSRLEKEVVRYFGEKEYQNGIDYECQKRFDDLTGTGNKSLSYDFIVYKDNEPYYLIECQGQQHYQAIDYFGGEEKFKQQQIHDRLKKEYANKLGIPLLEILYTLDTYEKIAQILKSAGI